jgi:hypothetical protein
MFSEVFEPSSGLLKDDASASLVKCLRQVLRLFKKIQLSDESSEELDSIAKAEFFSNDTIVQNVVLDARMEYLLRRVARHILPNLCGIDFEDLVFKHGPGAVAEGDKGNQKWSSLLKGILTDAFDVDGYGYRLFGLNAADASLLQPYKSVVDPQLFLQNGSCSSIARLVCVPKNSTSARTITVEPLLNQFVQQGLNTVLREHITRCEVLSQCLALTDQSKNQILALEGSQNCKWSTLDLKSASDLLSQKLVETVFGNHGPFLDRMIDCRTPRVSNGSSAVKIWKFAGMGNALTFPTQSVVFAVVAIAAICDSWGKTPTFKLVKHAATHIQVFGDDIIVDSRYASQVVSWIEMVGLKVNHNKSFLEGNFKESCGVDAFMGVDVTPIYLRYRPDQSSTEAKAIAGLVSTSNQAWLACLYSFSDCLREIVEERLRKRLPLVSRKSGALGWHTRLDGMNPHRWNRTLHRFETQSFVDGPLKRRDSLDGYAALLKYFHNSGKDSPEFRKNDISKKSWIDEIFPMSSDVSHLKESSVRFQTRLRKRWVPTISW